MTQFKCIHYFYISKGYILVVCGYICHSLILNPMLRAIARRTCMLYAVMQFKCVDSIVFSSLQRDDCIGRYQKCLNLLIINIRNLIFQPKSIRIDPYFRFFQIIFHPLFPYDEHAFFLVKNIFLNRNVQSNGMLTFVQLNMITVLACRMVNPI